VADVVAARFLSGCPLWKRVHFFPGVFRLLQNRLDFPGNRRHDFLHACTRSSDSFPIGL
jgi:hypothetical protein